MHLHALFTSESWAYVKTVKKELYESHFSTGCSKAMPGKDSEIKNEIDEMVPDTSMHQA